MAGELSIDRNVLAKSVCEFIETGELSEPASRAKVVTFNDIGDLSVEYLLEMCAFIDHAHDVAVDDPGRGGCVTTPAWRQRGGGVTRVCVG